MQLQTEPFAARYLLLRPLNPRVPGDGRPREPRRAGGTERGRHRARQPCCRLTENCDFCGFFHTAGVSFTYSAGNIPGPGMVVAPQ